MKLYPIRLFVKPYNGKDPNKKVQYEHRLECAKRIEEYLNSEVVSAPDGEPQVFDYYHIAEDLHLDESIVHEILYAADAGSNGITICKGRPAD